MRFAEQNTKYLFQATNLEEMDDPCSAPIPLPNVTYKTISLIAKYLVHHANDPIYDEYHGLSEAITKWDMKFLEVSSACLLHIR